MLASYLHLHASSYVLGSTVSTCVCGGGGGGGVYVLYQCEGAYVYTFDTNYVLGTIVLLSFWLQSKSKKKKKKRRRRKHNQTSASIGEEANEPMDEQTDTDVEIQ